MVVGADFIRDTLMNIARMYGKMTVFGCVSVKTEDDIKHLDKINFVLCAMAALQPDTST